MKEGKIVAVNYVLSPKIAAYIFRTKSHTENGIGFFFSDFSRNTNREASRLWQIWGRDDCRAYDDTRSFDPPYSIYFLLSYIYCRIIVGTWFSRCASEREKLHYACTSRDDWSHTNFRFVWRNPKTYRLIDLRRSPRKGARTISIFSNHDQTP